MQGNLRFPFALRTDLSRTGDRSPPMMKTATLSPAPNRERRERSMPDASAHAKVTSRWERTVSRLLHGRGSWERRSPDRLGTARVSGNSNAHSRARRPASRCRRSKREPDGADLEIGVPGGHPAFIPIGGQQGHLDSLTVAAPFRVFSGQARCSLTPEEQRACSPPTSASSPCRSCQRLRRRR
jgi:hypothetical protein